MKKNLFYVGALFLGLILGTSCSEEDGLVKNKQTLVEATINNPASRTTVSSDYKVVWSQDDAYTVWSSEGIKKGELTLATGEGSTTGSFTGTLNPALANGDVALFPSVSGDSKSYTFKSEYSTTETDAPMLGTYNGTSFSFNHLAAFIRVNANDLPAGDAVLTIESTNQALAGEATLTAEKVLIPSVEGKIITVTFTAEEGQDLVFDAPIPAQAYDKITLTLKVGETEIFQKERALNAVVGNLYELTSTKQMTVEEANDVLEGLEDNKSLNVNISAPNNNATITVPAAEGSVLNMDISNVSDGASITINNNESVSVGESQQNIGVNVANDESSAIDMTINTPTATVEVGKGYFTTVTATTATNTLIVGKGATIANLVVAAGNVRIEDGGTVTSITRSVENNAEKTYVIFEGTLPTEANGDSNIAYISAAEWDLRKAIEDETLSSVTIDGDVILTSQLTINRNLTLDLAGHTISNETDIWNNAEGVKAWSLISVQGSGVEVTISGNGTLRAKENDCHAVDIRGGATLNIEGGTYVGNISAVYVYEGEANISGGTFSIQQLSTPYNDYRYTLNCLDENYQNETASINVTGGSFYNFDPANNLAEGVNTNFVALGYSIVQNGEYYAVSEGIQNEAALITAIANAEAGSEIALAGDIVLTSQLTINRSLTLNLGSHTISNETDIWNTAEGVKAWSLISVQGSDVEVTISGKGTLKAKENDCHAVDVRGGATVNIEGGTYVGNISAVYVNEGEANISGGTFCIQQLSAPYNDYRYTLNCLDENYQDDTATINVTGGSFYNFNPGANLAEGADTNFLGSTCTVSETTGENDVTIYNVSNSEN